ncbi:TYROSINE AMINOTRANSFERASE [Salix koriyanagi]|uniref:TYROSINE AMINOTRANSFERASE n=1 Tax=Salix koriyanagi TaxID=2511006 RepID=A0A9Q0ZGR6_9ROSI|nr:TYROSINE AMINOTRANSFERASE [Salix koriyanagi]
MVIINPGNPSGCVYTYNHLNKIAETARKLGIVVIADEVYGHLVYGSNPFVPMSLFATTVPVITLGSIAESINKLLVYSPFPPTLIQGAIPQILEKTTQDFFSKTINILRKNLEICYDKLKEIPCMMIPQKPEGAFFAMVKLNLLLLEDIEDDMDFCLKLAKEESLIILPGVTVGLKNWLCMTFAVEYSSLEDGLGRLESFCQRHAKKIYFNRINSSRSANSCWNIKPCSWC